MDNTTKGGNSIVQKGSGRGNPTIVDKNTSGVDAITDSSETNVITEEFEV